MVRMSANPSRQIVSASWGGVPSGEKGNRLINPYTELTDDVDWVGRAEKPGPVGMKLNIDDILVLAEHLSEDWHILAVSFWRDFHPGRNLHTTREILIDIINGLASEKLVNVERLIDEETTAAEIKRIQAWAAKRAGQSSNDLKLDAPEGRSSHTRVP